MTHGFFAWMGGFMLYVNGIPRATLTPDELLQFVHEGSVDMPVITEEEIEDRSKGDGLSKGVTILQLAWFCVPYGLWWKKPKDVGRPLCCSLESNRISAKQLSLRVCRHSSIKSDLSFSSGGGWFFYLVYPVISVMGFGSLPSSGAVHSRRTPSLGGYGKYHGEITLLIGCFSGIVFGGIHCLGWNFSFQKHTEQTLWHGASLAVLCIPLCIYILFCYCSWLTFVDDYNAYFMVFTISISSLIYVAARITLIVLMMQSLQSLPPGVYDTVAWNKFVPHF
ncbi:uncharacterized protein EDB91DRAFT_1155705 [Suillus paluster]|uniref:uncharacterized protein n=1 Tax=Suillus paluster TaxID=48578 RepID=UPI001B860697|nr:uncharacterized protein EDB91DRAFT_1155705 [Suillus paluster]KAG1730951.1 hypothetical protein EDB91DRAFT_1155705 [Suillus paluster]